MALTDNLISYWKLDEASGNALDAHGSNTLTETSGTIDAATGVINGGRDFESIDTEYFTCADNAGLSAGDVDFTIAAWVRRESLAFGAIASKHNGATIAGSEWTLVFQTSPADRFRFSVYSGSSETQVIANNFGAPVVDTWYHVVAWHDSVSNVIGISVNAGTPNTEAHTTGVNDTTAGFFIGVSGAAAGTYHDGIIDEVGFWKRVLTSDERTSLYNSGSGLAYPFSSGGSARLLLTNAAYFGGKL